MLAKEKDLLEYLHKIFPEQVIYAEQYTQKLSTVVNYGIYRCAKAMHMSSEEWLVSKGFLWKETGYIELDMQHREAVPASQNGRAYNIANYVFQVYPLAGEYHLMDEEDTLLYQSASETVKKILLVAAPCIGTQAEHRIALFDSIRLLR